MGNIVLVQQIHTRWTKTSRGGENASRRNAVPEAARTPVQRIKEANVSLAHHMVCYGERDLFSRPYEKICVNPIARPLVVGCVTINYSDEEAIVAFRYDRGCGGAPDRGWARKTLHLAVGEWGQIVYNGRFTPDWEGDWWYEKMVVNVGLFKRLVPGAFTKQEPAYRFSAMGELF